MSGTYNTPGSRGGSGETSDTVYIVIGIGAGLLVLYCCYRFWAYMVCDGGRGRVGGGAS